jgi:leader peptidase (prepilin peptidase) / N-methyltransferase
MEWPKGIGWLMRYLFGTLFFLLGGIIGSFLNVCIYRLPRSKSIVSPPSACPQCAKPIKFYDNVPLISYLVLKGKCRYCGARISVRYPVVEFIAGFLFLWLYRQLGLSFELFVFLFFICTLIVISFIDLEYKIIPDVLSIGGIVAGLLFAVVRPLFSYLEPRFNILDGLYGVLLGGGILFAIAWAYQFVTKREGMGGGDIKLLAMIGSFCGIKGVIFSLVSGSLLGTLVGIPLMLAKGENSKYAIPFGPFLSLGAVIYVYMGGYFINMVFGVLEKR